MWANESQLGTSSLVVSGVSSSDGSSKTERAMAVTSAKMASAVGLAGMIRNLQLSEVDYTPEFLPRR
jgi:hypothetical protein